MYFSAVFILTSLRYVRVSSMSIPIIIILLLENIVRNQIDSLKATVIKIFFESVQFIFSIQIIGKFFCIVIYKCYMGHNFDDDVLVFMSIQQVVQSFGFYAVTKKVAAYYIGGFNTR